MLGAGDGRLLYSLAAHSDLKICCLEPNDEVVASTRTMLDKAKRYGVQVVVHHGSLAEVRYPEYFADLIVLEDVSRAGLKGLSAKEIYRLLHPYGGTVYVAAEAMNGGPGAIRQWLLDGGVPAAEVTTSEKSVQVVRDGLPGAGNWTHEYADAGKSGASADQRAACR